MVNMLNKKTPRRRWARLGIVSSLLVVATGLLLYVIFEYGLLERDAGEILQMRSAISDGDEIE